MRLLPAVLASALASGVPIAHAVCVNPGGTGGCFATIQAAVDAAPDGDSIDIAAGTYAGDVAIDAREGLRLQGAGVDQTNLDPCEVRIRYSSNTTLADLSVLNNGYGIGVEIGSHGGFPRRNALTVLERVRSSGHVYGIEGSYGTLVVRQSTVSGNSAIGIRGIAELTSEGRERRSRLFVSDSAIVGNNYGIYAYSTPVTITTSTISGNGNGVFFTTPYRPARLSISQSTIANNQTGILGFHTALVFGTILGDNVTDCDVGLLRSRGYNLVEAPCTATLRSTDLTGVDPALDVLADNGGPTSTHALLAGSPALGAMTIAACRRQPDQRGVARVTPCDIGAFEAP